MSTWKRSSRTFEIGSFVLLAGCSKTCGHTGGEPIRSEPVQDVAAIVTVDAVADTTTVDVTLDGCVDVEADVRARYDAWSAHAGGAPDFDAAVDNGMYVRRSEIADLDGDGVKEVIWAFATPPVEDTQHVYRGGTCSAHLGEVQGGVLEVEKTKHDGYADLTVSDYGSFCEGARCGCTPERRRYEFSAGAYKENAARRAPGSVTPCGDP